MVRPNDFFKVLHGIRAARYDYFFGLAFSFGCGQFAGAGDWTNFLAHPLPPFRIDILPEPNDVPVAILLNTTVLTRSS
jgi:hypothetical protein